MTPTQLKALFFQQLLNIAPEVEPDEVDPEADLREELDIDSMDFMMLTVALGKQLGINIPETDHHQLNNVNNFLLYLQKKVSAG